MQGLGVIDFLSLTTQHASKVTAGQLTGQFTYKLCKALLLLSIHRKYENNNGIKINVLQKMQYVRR